MRSGSGSRSCISCAAGSGAGSHASTCVLMYQTLPTGGRARLDALVETTDGFVIAERDLALRGPGDFFGTRQSGLPTLRVGDLLRDHALMEDARREAVAWLDSARRAAARRLPHAPTGRSVSASSGWDDWESGELGSWGSPGFRAPDPSFPRSTDPQILH